MPPTRKITIVWDNCRIRELRHLRNFPSQSLAGLFAAILLLGAATLAAQTDATATSRTFDVRGVIIKIEPGKNEVVIKNEIISNYMEAMTMPFPLKTPDAVSGLDRGDQVKFQLHVDQDESWADHFLKIGAVAFEKENVPGNPASKTTTGKRTPLLDYKFTNELGQAMSFNDFHGQALAVTFFYTRCPLPDFCPRLSRNFQEASEKLEAMKNAPTNWHFISVSFDPEFDTPETLLNYGKSYHYDPAHWSFFTGPKDKIAELARGAGVEYDASGGTINHNFRTMIVNAQGHLQMIFPTSGDLSDQIVSEILKAARVQSDPPAAIH
ncbi:MAG TPA: SCO family protein [Verrucomicrobiae bacterium]|nr:SCO family protein [Verrucomicrobiae bacterium]